MLKQLFHKSAAKIIAASLIVMLALAALPAKIALADSVTLTTSGTWTVPAGVTSISIECWGGGGGGASVTVTNTGGGGGGGGAYSKINTYGVTPGANIPYTIGAGGNAGTNGGNTSFNATVCVAAGGSGTTTATGGVGGVDGSGDVHFPGGYGYTWSTGAYGAGGGGSAGTGSAGNNATATIATTYTGAAAETGGGPGGNGANGAGNGSTPSSAPGGGGGGAYRTNQNRTGGAGYRGQIIITYVALPTLTSPTATAITSTTATLGANITSNGGGTISQYGTCWGASANPTLLTGTCTSKGAGAVGVFTDPVTSLTASAQIFYDGYATNSTGTSYSPGGSFYTEPSAPATAVSFTNVLGNSMTVNWTRGTGGDGVIVLMKAGSAVNSDPVDGTFTAYNANAAFGSGAQIGTGNYVVFKASGTSANITGLTPGTTYHVAVYEYKGAVNTSGTAQGTNYLQTTPATSSQLMPANLSTLTSPTATAITSTTATLGANITSNGGGSITQYGTCWGTSEPLTLLTGTCTTKGAGTTGVFTDSVTGLTAGTHIFYNGYATNSGGTGYSPNGSFYTEPSTQASGVNFTNNTTGTSLTINWTRGTGGDGVIILMKAGSAITGVPADGTYTTYNASANLSAPGTLITDAYVVFKAAGTSVAISGLLPGTTYYVRVFEYKGTVDTSGVDQGTNYKLSPAAGSITTPTIPPTVTTGSVTGRKRTSAILNGTVNPNGSSTTVTFVYGPTSIPGITPPTPYPFTITADVSPVTGTLAVPVSAQIPGGLTPNTTYYYRAVGTNAAGTVYGSEVSFTTLVAGGTTYYVDKTNVAACSDSGSGTISTPFCSIGAGAAVADAGDTVWVLHGSYAETVKPSYNGGPGALLLTFKADPGVIVTGNGCDGVTAPVCNGGAFRLFSKGYIVIDGFTITGTKDDGIIVTRSQYITISHNHVSGSGTTAIPKRGINLSSTTNSTINANTTDHNTNDGILLRNSSNNSTVSNNISFANAMVTASQAAGISFLDSTNNTVSRNIVYGNEDSGINFYSASTNNIVVNNLSFGNGDHGFDCNDSPHNTFISNTVSGNGTAGIDFEASSGSAVLYNNISVDNGYRLLSTGGSYNDVTNPGNLRFDDTSITGNTLDYDILYSSTTDNIIWSSSAYSTLAAFREAHPTLETHGVEANPLVTPLFVGPTTAAKRTAGTAPYTVIYNPIFDATHPTGDNYHLAAGSIAIDSANSSAPNEQTTDIEGNPRVDILTVPNTGVGVDDRGAYEYQLPQNQVINFTSTAPANAVVGGPTYTPTATGGGSGNPVVFTIDATASSICSINLGVVSFTAVGTCVIDANQAGGFGYNPAPQVQQSFAVGMGSQVITFTSTAPTTVVVGGPTYTPTATGGASLNPVTFTIDASATSVCSIGVANAVSFTAIGICKINADQAGNTNYNPAPQVSQSIAVGLGSQTINVLTHAPTSAIFNSNFTVSATATSGLPIAYTASGACTNVGPVFTMTRAFGTCTVHYNQAGDSNFAAAPEITDVVVAQGNIVYLPLLNR